MYNIRKMPEYLSVTLEGEATYQVFKNAIKEVLAREDYPTMNDIWCLDNCVLSVSHSQFYQIVKDVQLNYPPQATRTKTALVASSGISRALAQFWVDHADILPYEIQIFMGLREAEKWIISPVERLDQ